MDGRAVRWQKHNEARRERLVAVAVELIESGERDFTLQQVGDRAGLSRSVVYRHFADRRDLLLAVQRHVLDGLRRELEPSLQLHGTIRSCVEGIVRAYVGWAVAHPELHRLADYGTGTGEPGPLQETIDLLAAQIGELFVAGFELHGAEVTTADRQAADPLVHGLIGMVFSAVHRWVHLGERVPDAEHMAALITEAILALIAARARGFGLELDPDVSLELLLTPPPA